ncbi:WhiB family transcriptional regulator [Pseudonocardiaceae bacterium YIM PH 21723]|nr:WhiB family transcriptional regulator [Pseudonocardiaceae bacterium YIM PH 21723]
MADTRLLPPPRLESWAWQQFGACREDSNAPLFDPGELDGGARLAAERRAKAVCQHCPVIVQCRRHALEAQEPYGVWGGLGANERRHAIERRNRIVAEAIA